MNLRQCFLMLCLVVLATAPLAGVHAAWQSPNAGPVAAGASPATGIAPASSPTPYFTITPNDVAMAVAKQLQLQAVEEHPQVTLAAGTPPTLYSANHPLSITIHALQIDTASKRWQAQAYIVANGKTETVKPISGIYAGMINVPVLIHQVTRNERIEASDLSQKLVPSRLVRKDTITDASQLIGQSPRAVISADRPIRQSEVSAPIMVKKGDAVELTYTNPHMSIKTSGIALQDGAKGDMIRVKNEKSEKAVSGRVAAAGRVEVNSSPAL